MKKMTTILSAVFIFLTLLLSVAKANDSCINSELLTHPELPKCGSSDLMQFPDASKPTGAVFLSYTGRNEETIVTAYDAIKNLNQKIKLNIMITQTDLTQLHGYQNNYCNQSNNSLITEIKCTLVKALADTAIVNLIYFTQPGSQRYLQDYLQFYLSNGKVNLFPLVNPFETTDFFSKQGELLPKYSIASDVSRACGLQQTKLNLAQISGNSGTMGGNLESLPGNIVMLGEDSSSNGESAALKMNDSDLATMIKKNYPPNITEMQIAKIISIARNTVATSDAVKILLKSNNVRKPDTKLTLSSHADETFSVVKSNAKCGYTVLMPSPGLALKMLGDENGPENKENCLSTGGTNSKTDFPNDPVKLTAHMNSGCVGFRGLTYSEIRKDQDFTALNQELQDVSGKNETLIRSVLKTSCPQVDILKVPYLIKKAPWGQNEMITPNVVNALVITPFGDKKSIFINNPTFVKGFDDYLSFELKRRGIESHFVLDSDYFAGFGGLHCGSSTIQLCR